MNFTAAQIAAILEGDVVGDPNATVSKLSKIEEGSTGSLTFLSNPKYANYIYTTQATITIVNASFEPEGPMTTTMIKVEDSYLAFTKLLQFYDQARKGSKNGIEQPSVISDQSTYGEGFYLGSFSYIGTNVHMGSNVKIYPNCYVGDNVVLGDDVTLFSGAKVYHDCLIGNGCVIHSNAVVGADGFGFAPEKDGSYSKIPQIGNVILEELVEVGASTTIDRATMGSTIIRRGVKLDNQIQIAHNVEIGEDTVIAAQTGIAGSTKIGKNCVIGGQVGFAGHITVGNNVRIQAQSGVGRNVKDGEILQGSPAFTYNDYSKSYVHFKNLPKIIHEIEAIKTNINTKNKQNG